MEDKSRTVEVTITGHFEIKESELEGAYEAKTFEEALENQRRWVKDGETGITELFNDNPTVQLKFVD